MSTTTDLTTLLNRHRALHADARHRYTRALTETQLAENAIAAILTTIDLLEQATPPMPPLPSVICPACGNAMTHEYRIQNDEPNQTDIRLCDCGRFLHTAATDPPSAKPTKATKAKRSPSVPHTCIRCGTEHFRYRYEAQQGKRLFCQACVDSTSSSGRAAYHVRWEAEQLANALPPPEPPAAPTPESGVMTPTRTPTATQTTTNAETQDVITRMAKFNDKRPAHTTPIPD